MQAKPSNDIHMPILYYVQCWRQNIHSLCSSLVPNEYSKQKDEEEMNLDPIRTHVPKPYQYWYHCTHVPKPETATSVSNSNDVGKAQRRDPCEKNSFKVEWWMNGPTRVRSISYECLRHQKKPTNHGYSNIHPAQMVGISVPIWTNKTTKYLLNVGNIYHPLRSGTGVDNDWKTLLSFLHKDRRQHEHAAILTNFLKWH